MASTAMEEEMVVWAKKALNLKLLRKGVLTHIYDPMETDVEELESVRQGSKWLHLTNEVMIQIILSQGTNSWNQLAVIARLELSPLDRSHQERSVGSSCSENSKKIIDFASHEPAVPRLLPPGLDTVINTESQ